MTADFRKTLEDRHDRIAKEQKQAQQAAQSQDAEKSRFVADFQATMTRDVQPVLDQFVKEVKAAGYDAQLMEPHPSGEPHVGVLSSRSEVKRSSAGWASTSACLARS